MNNQFAEPLAGVKVVAIEQAVAGPLCSRHLRDLGASVVKVERPGSGDFARYYDELMDGESTYFVWLNRGKRSLAIDLKSSAGRDILNRLVGGADVLLSNLGPGALERLVDLEALTEANPRLVHCSISGYGTAGPYRDRKAFDLLVQGEAGITLSTGNVESPAKVGVSLVDLAGGVYATAAINAALVERSRSGHGTRIDISLFDVMTDWMMPILLAAREGRPLVRSGMHHASITPYGPYLTADGVTVNLAVQNDAQWRRLCELVLSDDELVCDVHLATNAGRLRNRAAVEDRVATAIRNRQSGVLIELLEHADIPWGYVNDTKQVLQHAQIAALDRWFGVDLPSGRRITLLTDPFSAQATLENVQVPAVGGETQEILHELGYESQAIKDLEDRGAFGSRAAEDPPSRTFRKSTRPAGAK